MQAISIVDDYIIRAIQRAQFERLADGSVTAWAPDFPGLLALGPDGKACMNDLWRRLDEWVQASFEEGLALPVVDSIDLNAEDNRKLASLHEPGEEHDRGRFFETDDQFLAALSE